MTSVDTHGAPAEIQNIVEGSALPPRLRERVYASIAERDDVDPGAAERIVELVRAEYEEYRVDPLEPVGTVSAQSIGEPGTQMSIPGDEQILIRDGEQTNLVEIGPWIDEHLDRWDSRSFDGHEVARLPEGAEALSLRDDEKLAWKSVEEISRHQAPEELLEFTLEGGRQIRATGNHSFVTRRENEIVPVQGEELTEGDWIPVVGSYSPPEGQDDVDLREWLPRSEYWYTSELTDGGATIHPGVRDQLRNKRKALEAEELEDNAVYPVQGTVSLPEQFPLDEQTGFFIGAWLAEGHVTDYYVTISNVEDAFQDRIREFGDRFDLSVNEYETRNGFADGYDIRLNGQILADYLRSTCLIDGGKIVPSFAYGASVEFVEGLLDGYFSGDGNIGRASIRASSTDASLTEGIALLLGRLDVYATLGWEGSSRTLRIPKKFTPQFAQHVQLVGDRKSELRELCKNVSEGDPDAADHIPAFGNVLKRAAKASGIPSRQVHSATQRQRIGRKRLRRLLDECDEEQVDPADLELLENAIEGDVIWERIQSVDRVEPGHPYVYDISVEGLETFTTGQGVITHNTMNTFHYAGVAEIDVTQGLPRLIEIVDARKTPDTPTMKVFLEEEYATERERAHEVIWKIEATRILALGDVSTNVADMRVRIDLNEETLEQRRIEPGEIAETIESELGAETVQDGTVLEFGPDQPSYRRLLQLVEELREVVFKGLEDISRVVVRKEETEKGEEFVLYTEGSSFGDALDIEGVDASRTTSNDIHEVYRHLGVEAAREAIINEMSETLEEQGLDDVNVRHLMLVADIMTSRGTIESIGRHGIAGSKESVLARAAYEVTVNHLLDAAVHGEVDGLDGVIENVIVGKPIKLGTGDVDLRMGSIRPDGGATE